MGRCDVTYIGYIAHAKASVLGAEVREVSKPNWRDGYHVEIWRGFQRLDRFSSYEEAVAGLDKRIQTLEGEV